MRPLPLQSWAAAYGAVAKMARRLAARSGSSWEWGRMQDLMNARSIGLKPPGSQKCAGRGGGRTLLYSGWCFVVR